MKQILVPIDFSECAENALVFAIQLADKINANIEVLHVGQLDAEGVANPSMVSFAIQEKVRQSKNLMNETIRSAIDKIDTPRETQSNIHVNIEMGVINTKIAEVAAGYHTDLIVMGTHGEQRILDRMFGSTTSNILKQAPCPVLVIPESARFEEKMILGYATDLMDADPFEIWKASKLLKAFEPTIKCIHFNTKQATNKDKLKELSVYFAEVAPDLDITFHNLQVKDKVQSMNEFVEKQNINMLVMYKPQRNFFAALFHRSFTEEMAMQIAIPLLVVKENG